MNASPLRDRMHRLAPGIAAGTSLGISDVLAKFVLTGGVDVVSMLSFRSLVGLAFVASWFRFGRRPTANVQVRVVSTVVGIIFAALIFCLFKAIETIDVPTAILSYFTYPLLTGLTAAVAGLEPLRWKGMLCAIVAFCGLALLIEAHPAGSAVVGVAYAIGAAGCRTAVLLVTRAYLVGADARLTTWYSMLASTAIFFSGVIRPTGMEPATLGFGLDLPRGAELRHDGGDSVYISLNRPHRRVSHRGHAS